MSKLLGKSINSQVFDGGIEPRPVCGGMCGMACDSTGCNCSSVIDPRPKSLNDAATGQDHMDTQMWMFQ